jgi:alkylation response protein AidB-like acyl-CoA dehydrogenase
MTSDDAADELGALCALLEELSPTLNDVDDWPAHQFGLMAREGLLAWGLPPEYGGRDKTEREMLEAYQRLAAACLTTTFILTQRNAACQRLAASENDELKAKLLPDLCAGRSFATVGISHMTTSRQHLAKAAVTAAATGSGFILDGAVPWVTGALAAEHIVTGGTLADGRQVLMAVPVELSGLSIQAPLKLLALSASQTATVRLAQVDVPRSQLLAGPVEHVMKQGGGATGSLTTSALAIGMTAGVLTRFAIEAQRRPDLQPIREALENERADAAAALYAAAGAPAASIAPSPASKSQRPTSESVRQQANSLVLRAAQAYLAASKGAGFVAGHPAERAVREAMFFLVWSCPQPVVAAALREFACTIGGD